MNALCSTIKANVNSIPISKGVDHEDNVFLGEKIRIKTVRTGGRANKVKPVPAFSVLTQEINKTFLVSKLRPQPRNYAFGYQTSDKADAFLLLNWFQAFEEALDDDIHPKADPSAVASIVLGGGAGTRLFPLTRNRAKPAVRETSYIFALKVSI